jgi:hypothetical protein
LKNLDESRSYWDSVPTVPSVPAVPRKQNR